MSWLKILNNVLSFRDKEPWKLSSLLEANMIKINDYKSKFPFMLIGNCINKRSVGVVCWLKDAFGSQCNKQVGNTNNNS